jgi:hypothetical protein
LNFDAHDPPAAVCGDILGGRERLALREAALHFFAHSLAAQLGERVEV